MGREHERKEKKSLSVSQFSILSELCFESVFFEFDMTFLVILNSRVAMLHSYSGARGLQINPCKSSKKLIGVLQLFIYLVIELDGERTRTKRKKKV